MRIAVPIARGKLAAAFDQCDQFVVFEADAGSKEITSRDKMETPPHRPGAYPRWLADHGTDVLIARRIGPRAQTLLAQLGIKVVDSAEEGPVEEIAQHYLEGTLKTA
ncbi:MAG: ATPase [Candidatus Eisenbacteria bacterium]|nr:ATPase [Candidatus Eisenbacteria bacterium]